MNQVAVIFLLGVAPALSILVALLGLETLRENIIGWFLLLLGIAYPAGGVIYYHRRKQELWTSLGKGALRGESGDGSFWLILPGFLAAFFAPPLEWLYLPALLPRTLWLQITGVALILAGVALRLWARAHIGAQYTGHVEILDGHRLVQSGPYAIIRHPGYAGFLLMALGVTGGYASLIGLVAVLLLLLPGLVYRMNVEERLLETQFGEGFRQYARRTKRLLPGIW